MSYGREILLDVIGANIVRFNRKNIEQYCISLCDKLRLERGPLHFWDYDNDEDKAVAPPHLQGVSAVQFIMTSSIVIHTLDNTKQVIVNVFGCGEINAAVVERITIAFFGGRVINMHSIERGI